MYKQEGDGPRKNLEDLQSPPVLTNVLVLASLLMYWLPTQNRALMGDYAFQSAHAVALLQSHDFFNLAAAVLFSNFAQLALWQTLGNAYFLWLFGAVVERRFGGLAYLILILLGGTIPWVIQAWDGYNFPWMMVPGENGFRTFIYFLGPAFISMTIAGAYAVLAPRKQIRAYWGVPTRGAIFRNEKARPIEEHYGLSPATFMGAFFAFQLATHYFITVSYKGYDTAGLYAATGACLVGYMFTIALLQTAISDAHDGKMKLEAVKRYNDLLKLDVNSEEAIRGVAKAMGVSPDQARTWVSQGKGRLRIN